MKTVFSSIVLSLLVAVSLQQNAQRNVCTSPTCQRLASYFESAMNQNAKPCDDFYQFTCGKFAENAVIKAYNEEVVPFSRIHEDVDRALAGLLENNYNPEADKSFVKPMKDFYESCMKSDSVAFDGNDDFVNILKSAYIHTDFSGFDPLQSSIQITSNGIFADFLLDVHISRDTKNTSQYVFTARPHLGGLIHDVYYKQGIDNDVVKAEHAAMVKVAVALGFDEATAKSTMTKVQEMRVKLANSAGYNDATSKRMSFGEFEALVPGVSHGAIYKSLLNREVQNDETVIVYSPAYLKELAEVLAKEEKQTLAFQLFSTSVYMVLPYLSKEVRAAAFELNKVWYGVEAMKPRELQCVHATAKEFDVALSHYYIRNVYKPERKAKIEEMLQYFLNEIMISISESKVFSEQAKAGALRKARTMKRFIAYPEEYLSGNVVSQYYGSLKYEYSGNYFNKALSLFKQRFAQRFAKLDQQNGDDFSSFGDATEVNSDYLGARNAARITYAFINEPFYTDGAPTIINYGFMAMSVGHEVAQAFDSNNIHRDENGNANSFMDSQSTENYNKNAKCVEDYFGKLSIGGEKVDGARTLAENIADIEGVRIGFRAYKKYLSDKNVATETLSSLPYSDEQIYFIATSSMFCSRKRPEYFKYFLQTDNHAPRQYRVEALVSNNNDFAEAFGCPKDSPMNPANKCQLF